MFHCPAAHRLPHVTPFAECAAHVFHLIFLNIHLFNLFIYIWLCWVFVATSRLFSASGEQEVLTSRGARASH